MQQSRRRKFNNLAPRAVFFGLSPGLAASSALTLTLYLRAIAATVSRAAMV